MFELKERDGLARICELTTRHGKVTTPTLLPVVNPNYLTITPAEMRDKFGVRALITNSYIIRNTEELRERALESGVHSVLGFDGTVMTDSGTFQDYVYGSRQIDPQEIVKFQADIGSDIGTILDIFSEPGFTKEEAAKAVDVTIRRDAARGTCPGGAVRGPQAEMCRGTVPPRPAGAPDRWRRAAPGKLQIS